LPIVGVIQDLPGAVFQREINGNYLVLRNHHGRYYFRLDSISREISLPEL